jgi:single-strand DNA-binding protein
VLIELCRLGADAELKYTPSGEAVAELRLAYDVRVKNETRTQWVTASLWGKRAESTAQYLTKGKQLMVTMESPYVREWDNGQGYSMMSRIIDFKFAGGKEQGSQQQEYPSQYQQNQPAPRREPPPVQQPPSGFKDDEDIPF